MSVLDSLRALGKVFRADGWQNSVTGLGTTRDKRYYGVYAQDPIIPDVDLESIFNGDGIAKRIVKLVVEDALAKGVGFQTQTDEGEDDNVTENQQDEADIIGAFDDLKFVTAVKQARIWARLFGGAAIMPVLDANGTVQDPLDYNAIRSVRSLVVLDKRSITTSQDLIDNDPRSPTFGQPRFYRIQLTDARRLDFQLIHASRIIRFDGALTTERTKQMNQGWSLSVLQALYEPLRDFHAGYGNVGAMLAEGSVGVFKMKGLINAIASKSQALLQARFQQMDLAKSLTRSILLDADTEGGAEDYRREQITFNNVPDVLDRFAQRLAGCEGMPLTVLLGISPAGLNSTGESDLSMWDKRVASEQTDELKPPCEHLAKMILAAKDGPTRGKVPDNWNITFPPIREMTEEQTAKLRGAVATTDKIYADMGAITPAEVALSRFGRKGWSMDTKIDLDVREAEAEADRDAAMNPEPEPEPPIVPPPDPNAVPPPVPPEPDDEE